MKKFLLYTLEYPPTYGGVSDYYYNLIESWPEDNIDYYHLKDRNTHFYSIPNLAFDLVRKIDKETHLLVGHILPLGTVALFLSFFKKFQYSVILHGLDFSLATKNRRKRILSYFILKRTKQIICANSYLASLLIKKFPSFEDKLIISQPGARVGKLDLEIKKELEKRHNLKGKRLILSLGRLVKRKGFDLCLNALAQIANFKPDIFENLVYILAGQGEDKGRLQLLVKTYNLEDKVIFLEDISHQEKYAFYSLCDIFVMTPREIKGDYEGFGIVYLEANLFAKPVIASSSGGILDAVVDNFSGLVITPNDALALSRALIKLLTNKNLAQTLGRNGQNRAQNYFNWSYLANNLYKKL